MGVGHGSMTSFMRGVCLVQSETYVVGMKYLRTRMPISKCSDEERDNITNDKFVVTSRFDF